MQSSYYLLGLNFANIEPRSVSTRLTPCSYNAEKSVPFLNGVPQCGQQAHPPPAKSVGVSRPRAPSALRYNKAITSGDGGFVLSTRAEDDLKERVDSYATMASRGTIISSTLKSQVTTRCRGSRLPS